MFLRFSKYIINNSILVLSIIALISIFFFYSAFISDNKLKVDFSLEQMFPTVDEDRDYYEEFKANYGREDNSIFLTFTNDDIVDDINLSIIDSISVKLRKHEDINSVISLASTWDGGEGEHFDGFDSKERISQISNHKLLKRFLSKDKKSSLIKLDINENIYSHDKRRDIIKYIDTIKDSISFNLVYDGEDFLIQDSEAESFLKDFGERALNQKIFIFSSHDVLSSLSLPPLESIINQINDYFNIKSEDNDDYNFSSIYDCYQKINENEDYVAISLRDYINKGEPINEDGEFNDINKNGIYDSIGSIEKVCGESLGPRKRNPYYLSALFNHDYSYISTNNKYTVLHFSGTDEDYQAVKSIISNNQYIKYKDWEWHEAGIPVLRTRYIELVERERMLFIPLAFLIAALTLVWVFRQIKTLLIALISILTSLVWISGIMAINQISINVISYLTFNLLMVIGVSDAIHLLMKYHEEIDINKDKKRALHRVIVKIGSALFLTSFTTSVGFLSLGITNVKILQEFGIIMGIGIGILFLITITLMPVMLYYIKVPDQIHIDRLVRKKELTLSYKILGFVKKRAKFIMIFSFLTILCSIYYSTKIDSSVTILGDLKPGNKLYKDINFVENNFGGTLPLEIVIHDLKSKELRSPIFKKKIDLFYEKLDQNKYIESVSGYYDIGGIDKSVNYRNFIKTSDLKNDIIGRETRISCSVINIDSNQSKELKDKIKNDYESIFKNNNIKLTGSTLLALKMNEYLIDSLLKSFALAFLIIFISMNILFRSFKLSFISILPNIIPLLCAAGVMGVVGIELRPATAMTFSIALGIAVDDTIHFLSRFREEYREHQSHKKATSYTILTTGRAIISTTITLGMGFLVLIFSNFKPNFEFGILATIILIVALVCSLILLPALINFYKPLKSNHLNEAK